MIGLGWRVGKLETLMGHLCNHLAYHFLLFLYSLSACAHRKKDAQCNGRLGPVSAGGYCSTVVSDRFWNDCRYMPAPSNFPLPILSPLRKETTAACHFFLIFLSGIGLFLVAWTQILDKFELPTIKSGVFIELLEITC